MTKQQFQKSFITNSNLAGKELLNTFCPHLVKKITLEEFEYTSEDLERFREDDNFFINYINDCTKDIKKKYSEFIRISKAFITPRHICFFVVIFNKSKYKSIDESLMFEECCDNFLQNLRENYSDKNSNFYSFDYCNTIFRTSTNTLFEFISDSLCNNPNSAFFSYIEELSNLTYEKNKTDGLVLLYSKKDINKIHYQFHFSEKKEFSKNNLKLIRKFLELSNSKEQLGLISDTEYIYGLATEDNNIDHYSVSFYANNSWELFLNNKQLIKYRNNRVNLDNPQIVIDEFENSYIKVFGNNPMYMKNISNGIKKLLEENKGTVLVISSDAETLISDYEDLCIKIDPQEISEENIKKLSSIDGAILIDENAICYGFGVILDGIDQGNGDPSRGSRYNSSERFYSYQQYLSDKNKPIKLLVFVLSDDGNYNIFPEIIDYRTLIIDYLSTHKDSTLMEMNRNLKFKNLASARLMLSILIRRNEVSVSENEKGQTVYSIKF